MSTFEEIKARHEKVEKARGFRQVSMSNVHKDRADLIAMVEEKDKLIAGKYKAWQLMKEDRNRWKARCNEPYDDSVIAENIKLQAQIYELKGLIIELTDPDQCRYDHHGYCQSHSLHEKPCPHERAKAIE